MLDDRCPQCSQRVRRDRPDVPAATWVAAARRNTLHQITASEGEALDRLAVALRSLRRRSGQSRVELARSSGLSASYLKDLEAGLRRPRLTALAAIAMGLRPPSRRPRRDGSVLLRGDSSFRQAWIENEEAVAQSAFLEMLQAVEGALAPSREEVRVRAEVLAG